MTTDEKILEELHRQAVAIERIEGLLVDVISSYMGGMGDFRQQFKDKRDARHRRRAGGSHTATQWQALKKFYGFTCLRCERKEPDIKLTRDHIDPNGTDSIENIQPLCEDCNHIKGNEVIDYRPRRDGSHENH